MVSARVHWWLWWTSRSKPASLSRCCCDWLSYVHLWWAFRWQEVSSHPLHVLLYYSVTLMQMVLTMKCGFRLGDFWVLDTGKNLFIMCFWQCMRTISMCLSKLIYLVCCFFFCLPFNCWVLNMCYINLSLLLLQFGELMC